MIRQNLKSVFFSGVQEQSWYASQTWLVKYISDDALKWTSHYDLQFIVVIYTIVTIMYVVKPMKKIPQNYHKLPHMYHILPHITVYLPQCIAYLPHF